MFHLRFQILSCCFLKKLLFLLFISLSPEFRGHWGNPKLSFLIYSYKIGPPVPPLIPLKINVK